MTPIFRRRFRLSDSSIRLALLFFLPILAFGQPFSKAELTSWKKQAASVTIIRDKWGTPHVYGRTDADAVFGLLYAQCEDDFDRVEMNYIGALGRLSEVKGEEEIFNDLRTRLYNDTVRAMALYQKSPASLQKLMNAFAAGSNYFLATHPDTKPKLIKRFQPWMPLLFSEGSIGGDLTSISVQRLKAFYSNVEMPKELDDDHAEPKGSNGFAIAPSRSESGNAMLLINPHTSFYFRSEVHMVSDEGLNAYGAVTWGQFFVYQGFNEYCGWMHTSTYADAVDEYLETVARRGDSLLYKHGDAWKNVRGTDVTIAFARDGKREQRTFKVYRTHHGPVVASRGAKWMTIQMMDDPVNALQQSFIRTKSKGYAEYSKAMDLRANSSNNTVFADRDGNIAYWHGNFIPVRGNQLLNYSLPVDGSDPDTDWQGPHEVKNTIHLHNPPNGWIQNCNSTPFTAADDASPEKAKYPRYMAPDGQNYRAINASRVLQKPGKLSLDALIRAAYDPALTAFEVMLPALEQAFAQTPDNQVRQRLTEPMQVVSDWDRRSTTKSVATTLAIMWGRRLQALAAPRMSEEVAAIRRSDIVFLVDFMLSSTTSDEKVQLFFEVVTELERDYGTWQVPWGDVNRFQRLTGKMDETFDDNRSSLPVGFASSLWGSLAAFGSRPYPNTKKYYGNVGNSFVAVVEFGNRIKAKSIVTGGSASSPASPHFNDQSTMYASGQFKDVLFYKEDVIKSAERTYHPGN